MYLQNQGVIQFSQDHYACFGWLFHKNTLEMILTLSVNLSEIIHDQSLIYSTLEGRLKEYAKSVETLMEANNILEQDQSGQSVTNHQTAIAGYLDSASK